MWRKCGDQKKNINKLDEKELVHKLTHKYQNKVFEQSHFGMKCENVVALTQIGHLALRMCENESIMLFTWQ